MVISSNANARAMPDKPADIAAAECEGKRHSTAVSHPPVGKSAPLVVAAWLTRPPAVRPVDTGHPASASTGARPACPEDAQAQRSAESEPTREAEHHSLAPATGEQTDPQQEPTQAQRASPEPPLPTRSKLILSPVWEARIAAEAQSREQRVAPRLVVPRNAERYAERVTFVNDRVGAEAMVDLAKQRQIAWIGIDCEFRFSRPDVPTKNGRSWSDPRSVVPLLLAVAMVEPNAADGGMVYLFVIDLRKPDVLGALAELLRQPLPFVAHSLKSELFCLWQLDLPTPSTVWDTWAAERAFVLGLNHARYKQKTTKHGAEHARAKEEAETHVDFSCSLIATCRRHGVSHAHATSKTRLQQSFLTHPDGETFSTEQVEYAAADADAAARLYPIQVDRSVATNALDHLKGVEMPWAVTNAEMIWAGVRVDPGLCRQISAACESHKTTMSKRLRDQGLANVNSYPALKRFFDSAGLLEAFREGRSYTFDDKHLEAVEDRHVAIPDIRALRKVIRLQSDSLLTGALVGNDGRLHPEHRQLGAESSRNSMQKPSVGGIGRYLRPLVVPQDPENIGIGEVDLSQIEVLIAAAESRDPELLRMVNSGDVYSGMARCYYADQIPAGDAGLPDDQFKRKFGHFRSRMKVFTLAIIYNITPVGLSRQLGITVLRAEQERGRFLEMFSTLDRAFSELSGYGAIRGYAQLRTGLRRYRARIGRPSDWETNWLRNTPIQGSACALFKVAGNRLRLRYQYYGARLIMPLHDAFVFECPLAKLNRVAEITAEVMTGVVQEFYPVLNPQVDINISQPQCWNKDGKARSLELWLQDPSLAREYMQS